MVIYDDDVQSMMKTWMHVTNVECAWRCVPQPRLCTSLLLVGDVIISNTIITSHFLRHHHHHHKHNLCIFFFWKLQIAFIKHLSGGNVRESFPLQQIRDVPLASRNSTDKTDCLRVTLLKTWSCWPARSCELCWYFLRGCLGKEWGEDC